MSLPLWPLIISVPGLALAAFLLWQLSKLRRRGNRDRPAEIVTSVIVACMLFRLTILTIWPAAPLWLNLILPLAVSQSAAFGLLATRLRKHQETLFAPQTIARARALYARLRPGR